jgi:cytochrome bd ubiquinol oxidase subunit I
LAYEVLTAFFLEATFLGIMLFAFRKVPSWVHTGATALVAIGTSLSAFWILALNSWMHTPQGFEMIDGVAHATSWREIIFNPSMPYRLVHTLLSSGLTVAFLVGGLLAWRALRGDRRPSVLAGLKVSVVMMLFLAPAQALVGDLHGTNTRDHQPAKLAAMEALWETEEGAPLVLFALPDSETRSNRFEVAIPQLGSLIATRDPNGQILGLNDFEGVHPQVTPVFWGFHIRVGIGVIMMLMGLWGGWQIFRKEDWHPWFLRCLVGLTFSGWVATIAGWYVTEIGRQPWLVQGVLLARDAVGEVAPAQVGLTLTAYLVTYVFLLGAFIVTLYYLNRKAMEQPIREEGAAV